MYPLCQRLQMFFCQVNQMHLIIFLDKLRIIYTTDFIADRSSLKLSKAVPLRKCSAWIGTELLNFIKGLFVFAPNQQ